MMARVATLSSTLRLQSIGDHPTGAQNGQTTNRIFSVPLGADEESVAKNISNRWRPRIVNPRDKGLRLLLNVHRIFGVSSFGVSTRAHPLPSLVRFLSILWNLAVFYFTFYTFNVSTQRSRSSIGSSFANNSRARDQWASTPTLPTTTMEPDLFESNLTPLLNYIRLGSLVTYFLFNYLLNLYMSIIAKPLVTLFELHLHSKIDAHFEYSIGVRIVLIQLCLIVIISFSFLVLIFLQSGRIMLDRWLEVVLNLYALSSPVAFLSYATQCAGHLVARSTVTTKTSNNNNNNQGDQSDEQFSNFIESLLVMGGMMRRMSSLLGLAIMVILFNATIVCIGTLCLMVANFRVSYPSVIGAFIYIILLACLCSASVNVSEVAHEVADQFKLIIYRRQRETGGLAGAGAGASSIDCSALACKLIMLNTLPAECHISPLGLFALSRGFMLTFCGLVLSYSVIIIQTNETTNNPC